jgi:hypothetical protein
LPGSSRGWRRSGSRPRPGKTRIVCCKDGKRRGEDEPTEPSASATPFPPGTRLDRKTGEAFTRFPPAVDQALEAKRAELHDLRIGQRTDLTLDQLAAWLNPIVGGRTDHRLIRPVLPVGDGRACRRRVNFYIKRWGGIEARAAADPGAVQGVVGRGAREKPLPGSPPTGRWSARTDWLVRRAR